jgi:16S rRNA (cytidine1402-2'-O)-methyltransferase
MVFYEAPHKLRATLADLAETLGTDRKLSICREMTKLHEECIRTTLGEAVRYYGQTEPRGEFALVVEGASAPEEKPDPDDAAEKARALVRGGMTAKDAAKRISQETGISKNLLYKALIDSKQGE